MKTQPKNHGLFSFLLRFWPYLRPQKKMLFGASISMLCGVGLRMLEPWPLKFIFDALFANPTTKRITIVQLQQLSATQLILVSAMLLLGITALRALAGFVSTVWLSQIGNRMTTQLRRDLYQHLHQLSLTFHNKARSGDLTLRVISDIGVLKDVTITAILPLMSNAFILFGMVVVMVLLNWQLAILAFAVGPVFWLYSDRQSKRIKEVSRAQRKREGAMASTVSESISAIRTVQALTLESVFERLFIHQSQKEFKEGARGARLSAGLERGVDVTSGFATALVMGYGAWLAHKGSISPGDLLVFLNYLKSAFNPLRDFAKYTGRVAKASAAAERVLGILDTVPEVQDQMYAVRAPAFRGLLTFENTCFAYGPEQKVLQKLNLSIQPGERVAIVGQSGHGKSSLLSLVMRLYDPQAGRVLIDGMDVREFKLDSLRTQIGVVMQDSLLFAASIEENIAYGSINPTQRQVVAAAGLANAHEFIAALPQGYQTVLSERGSSLSGGQRQRIAIARATMRSAPILLLDEPTAGLDDSNAKIVMAALEKVSEGRTVLLVTHDMNAASRANRIVFLEHGKIVEQGTHAELMRLNERYATMYRLQNSESIFEFEFKEVSNVVSL